jgi:DNA-binding transcriptional LysR family regulator
MEAELRRSLPQLNALRSFEAAARHQSFTRAAQELCVTQGAVSHQVKALEAELGLKLFNRERQGLAITDAGRDYLAVVRDAFDRIALGTDRLLQRQHAGVITVSMSPDFAAKWLVSRLGRFAEAYPEIELKVSATMHHVDFAREDIDLAIRHGAGNWGWARCRQSVRGRAVSGLQPGSPRQPAWNPQSGGPAAVSAIAFERPERLVEMAGSGGRIGRRALARPDPQSRQHAD